MFIYLSLYLLMHICGGFCLLFARARKFELNFSSFFVNEKEKCGIQTSSSRSSEIEMRECVFPHIASTETDYNSDTILCGESDINRLPSETEGVATNASFFAWMKKVSNQGWREFFSLVLLFTLFLYLFLNISAVCSFSDKAVFYFTEDGSKESFLHLLQWLHLSSHPSKSSSFPPYVHTSFPMKRSKPPLIHSFFFSKEKRHTVCESCNDSQERDVSFIFQKAPVSPAVQERYTEKWNLTGLVSRFENTATTKKMLQDKVLQWSNASFLTNKSTALCLFSFSSSRSSFSLLSLINSSLSFISWGKSNHPSPFLDTRTQGPFLLEDVPSSSRHRNDHGVPSTASSSSLPPLPSSASANTLREVCHDEILTHCHPEENQLRCVLSIYREHHRQERQGGRNKFPSFSSNEPRTSFNSGSSDLSSSSLSSRQWKRLEAEKQKSDPLLMPSLSQKKVESTYTNDIYSQENAYSEDEDGATNDDVENTLFSPQCEDWLFARETCMHVLQKYTSYHASGCRSPTLEGTSVKSAQENTHKNTSFFCSFSEPARDCLRRAPLRLLPQSCRDSTYYRAVVQGGQLKSL